MHHEKPTLGFAYSSKRRRTPRNESLGPGDASFAPFDFIFGTKQVYSVPKLLREVSGDIYIITSKSELKLVFSVVFLYKPY